MAAEEECLQLTRQVVDVMKKMFRRHLTSAHGSSIGLVGMLRVKVQSAPPLVIRFDERIPVDSGVIDLDDDGDFIDLTTDFAGGNTQQLTLQTTKVACNRVPIAPQRLESQGTQTKVSVKDAETQMFLSMPTKERGTQVSVDMEDGESQTYGISQHDALPPFLYVDVAEDAGFSGSSDPWWRLWTCCQDACKYTAPSDIELSRHYTLCHHCACFNTLPSDDRSLFEPVKAEDSCLPAVSSAVEARVPFVGESSAAMDVEPSSTASIAAVNSVAVTTAESVNVEEVRSVEHVVAKCRVARLQPLSVQTRSALKIAKTSGLSCKVCGLKLSTIRCVAVHEAKMHGK